MPFTDIIFHTTCTTNNRHIEGIDQNLLTKTKDLAPAKTKDLAPAIPIKVQNEMSKCNLDHIKTDIFNNTEMTDSDVFDNLYRNFFPDSKQFDISTLETIGEGDFNIAFSMSIGVNTTTDSNQKKNVVLRVIKGYHHIYVLNKQDIENYNKNEYKGAFIQSLLHECINVPKIYAMGVLTIKNKDNFRVFQLMEHTGENLFDNIYLYDEQSNKLTEKPNSIINPLDHLRQIARVVECIHSKGIIHRDIKLENFSVKKNNDMKDKIYLLDFGAADYISNCTGGFTKSSHYYPYKVFITKSSHYYPYKAFIIEYHANCFDRDSDELRQRVKEYDIFALSVIIMSYIDRGQFIEYYKAKEDGIHGFMQKYQPKTPKKKWWVNKNQSQQEKNESKIKENLRKFVHDIFSYNVQIVAKYKEQYEVNKNKEDVKFVPNKNHTIEVLINILFNELEYNPIQTKPSGGKKLRKKVAKRKEEKTKKNVQKNRSTRKNKKKRKARRA